MRAVISIDHYIIVNRDDGSFKNADALIVGLETIDKEIIENALQLKFIAKHGVGVDNIDIEAASTKGVLNIVIIKVLVEDLPPQTMTAFRIMMAGITALIIIVLGKSFRRLSKREWIYTYSECYLV